LRVLIRCRTGDFVYTPFELNVMIADIKAVNDLAQQHPGREIGVVIGALTPEGTVHEEGVRL
jgi:copper homeostasis protein